MSKEKEVNGKEYEVTFPEGDLNVKGLDVFVGDTYIGKIDLSPIDELKEREIIKEMREMEKDATV